MLGFAKRITSKNSDYVIETLNLHQHWAGITRLLEIEEWPFIRADLEVSEHQPRAIGLVARRGTHVIGFFTIHHFADIGYLDLLIIDPEERRNAHLANELWRGARREMHRAGFTSQVAHCTRSTARILRLLGYRPGLQFKLLRRNAEDCSQRAHALEFLSSEHLPALIELDAQVFGTSRDTWLTCLMGQSTSKFVGRHESGKLVASACLRERRENSVCIDSCNALAFASLEPLLDQVMQAMPHKRLECFVQSGSDLEHYLLSKGFDMPDFFREIGPLVELRTGASSTVGLGPDLRTLSWI